MSELNIAPGFARLPMAADRRVRPAVTHRSCTVDGCARPHRARGLCVTHYQQLGRKVGVVDQCVSDDFGQAIS